MRWLDRVLVLRERPRGYRRKRPCEANSINCIIVVGCATFDSQNQVFLHPNIDTFSNPARAPGIKRELQERPQAGEGEDIYVTVEIPAFNINREIPGRSGKRVKMIGESRVAKISRRYRSDNFSSANR